jgi:hypothetical protein
VLAKNTPACLGAIGVTCPVTGLTISATVSLASTLSPSFFRKTSTPEWGATNGSTASSGVGTHTGAGSGVIGRSSTPFRARYCSRAWASGLRQVVAHVVLAAQFDRDRHAGRRNRDLGAEVLGQVPPQATARFIEGLAARFARQQQGVRAHQVRQRLHRFGQRFAAIHVQHRFVIAMQVEHDVGVDRHRQQDFLEQAGAGVRLPAFQRGERMRADQGDVGLGILAQLAFERLLEVGRDVFIGAVEIHAGRQIVAAEGRAVNRLRQADRVGGRHQDDLSLDPALGIEPVQFLAQEMGDQHGRHLIGMQRGLDVDLLATSGRAVVERGQLKGGDVVFDRDRVFGRMHG